MDEDSMVGRSFWGWFVRRVEDARGRFLLSEQQKAELRTGGNIAPQYFNDLIYERCWGDIPLIYYFGDCRQLPPIGMKPISDLNSIPKIGSSDLQGLITFKELLDLLEADTRSYTLVIDQVIRQDDVEFKSLLHKMRTGEMDDDSVNFLLSICL